MAKYAQEFNRTASTSLATGSIVSSSGTSARRGKLYDLMFGSEDTPADNAFRWIVGRVTAEGTNTNVTPKPLDGYATVVGPDDSKEFDTISCAHCQFVMHIAKRAEADQLGGFCRMCMKHICGRCADEGSCRPFEKKLDEYERRMRLHQELGLVLR